VEQLQSAAAVQQLQHVHNLKNVEEKLKQNGQPQQDQALALALITSFSVKTRLSRGGLLLHRVRVKKLHRQDQ